MNSYIIYYTFGTRLKPTRLMGGRVINWALQNADKLWFSVTPVSINVAVYGFTYRYMYTLNLAL